MLKTITVTQDRREIGKFCCDGLGVRGEGGKVDGTQRGSVKFPIAMKTPLIAIFCFVSVFRSAAVGGTVFADDGHGVIVLHNSEAVGSMLEWVAVTNYPRDVVVNQHVSFLGEKIGVYHRGEMPIALWRWTNDSPKISSPLPNPYQPGISPVPPNDIALADKKVLDLQAQVTSLEHQEAKLGQENEKYKASGGSGDFYDLRIASIEKQLPEVKGRMIEAAKSDAGVRASHGWERLLSYHGPYN